MKDMKILGLPENTKVYINTSLSPYFHSIAFKCRLLKGKSLIEKNSGNG